MSKVNRNNQLWVLLRADNIDEESIMICINDHPEYCNLQYNHQLPLLAAAQKKVSVEILMKMFDYYREYCSSSSSSNNYLLHQLSMYPINGSSILIAAVIDEYPDSVRKINSSGYYPLHIECMNQCRYDIIMKLLGIYPQAACIRAGVISRNLPLHSALYNEYGSSDTILLLINAYPDAVRMRGYDQCGNDGYLPLHIECVMQCRFDIIIKLLEIYPDSIGFADRWDRLPLHSAIQNMCDKSDHNTRNSTVFLIHRYPQAVGMMDRKDEFPLHIECKHKCRYEVIIKLLDIYPDAIRLRNIERNLPLHIVLHGYGLYCNVVSLLLTRYPDSIRALDKESRLPFVIVFDRYYKQYVSRAMTSSFRSIQACASAAVMINLYPVALYLPTEDPYIDSFYGAKLKPVKYRLLLNLAYHHILSSSQHMRDYHIMNFEARSPLLHLLYQLSYHLACEDHLTSFKYNQLLQEQLMKPAEMVVDTSVNKNGAIIYVVACMLRAAGKIALEEDSDIVIDSVDDNSMRYGWMKGDDLGCILQRKVVLYL